MQLPTDNEQAQIDEFMPQKSIVIPPDKMAAFYSHHKVDNEAYPLTGKATTSDLCCKVPDQPTALFRCRTKGWSVGIEDMYQDLGCEYYLIPKGAKSCRPSIPALTPRGFATWMLCHISAHPDAEAKRLHQIVSELPINADGPWDGITERLPKQISRHLFPDKPDRKARSLVDDVIRDFADEFLPPQPKQSVNATRLQRPSRIDIKPENLAGSCPASTSSPHTAKSAPEPRSMTVPRRGSWSPPPPPARLGRDYSGNPSRRPPLVDTGRHNTEAPAPALQPPPLARSSSAVQRHSSPDDLRRRSVGDLARANPPLSGSPTGREEEYKQYVPTRTDYTPKSVGVVDRATPRRVAVAQADSGNPGPTWDEYLGGRHAGAAKGGMFGRGHNSQKASV